MEDTQNYILQITDSVTTQRCALRIELQDTGLPLKDLLDKYLKRPPLERLLEERRITEESAQTLSALQDLVYMAGNDGQLGGMFAGVVFRHRDQSLDLKTVPAPSRAVVNDTPVLVINLSIDRLSAGYDRNWAGFHRRRWAKGHKLYSDFVLSVLEREYGPAGTEAVLQMDSKEHKLEFVQALARSVWESDFESYSRFTGRKLVYKTGDETVRNMTEGAGGICSEKVQALKFLTDHYGLPSEYILAGADAREPIPEARLREMLETFDFRYSKRYMRYWQHTALLYDIEGTTLLVDATNGNIPLLTLKDDAAESILGYRDKRPVPVKMVVNNEDFYYHRVSQDIPEKLFFAMEGWIEYTDLVQVFDNELGLYLTADFFVTPIVFRSARAFNRLKQEYVQVCERAGLEYEVSPEWSLDSSLGHRLMERAPQAGERVLLSKEHLLKRYDESEGSGHQAGLVIMKLHKGERKDGSDEVRDPRKHSAVAG